MRIAKNGLVRYSWCALSVLIYLPSDNAFNKIASLINEAGYLLLFIGITNAIFIHPRL